MVDRDRLYGDLNDGILAERHAAFKRNLDLNLPLIRRHGGLSGIVPALKGTTALVIGAGPSLDRNLPVLKKYQQRQEFVFIAADMALRPLARAGIRPRFVVSCETSPVDFFGDVDTAGLHLVAFSCMSAVNLRKWLGGMSFYNWMIHRPEYDALWEKAGHDLGFLGTGSLVTTQAAALALGCGAAGLVLVGNDLGFTDRFYARGAVAHRDACRSATRTAPVETGEALRTRRARAYRLRRGAGEFFTTRQFLAGKLWLEDLFKGSGVPVCDCSDPGCSEKYVAKMELRDFMDGIDRRPGRKRRKV
jgi:hypothetical protein